MNSTIFQRFLILLFSLTVILSCKKDNKELISNKIKVPEGMVWVEGKTFLKGAKEGDFYAMMREKPAIKFK